MKLRNRLLLGFSITGVVLFVPGAVLFGLGGIGTCSLKGSYEPKEDYFNHSGYFYQEENFNKLIILDSVFTKDYADKKGFSYNMLGFANYALQNQKKYADGEIEIFKDKMVPISEWNNFFNATIIDNALFITGAVLWPVGLTTSLICMPLFFFFKRKDN